MESVWIARANFTHSVGIPPLLLSSTNFPHFLTTSSIVGRFLGSVCQQLSMSFHISLVSPTAWAFAGISGLSPSKIVDATTSFSSSSNGTLPVKTSTASIAKENTSAGFDSTASALLFLGRGRMISGASHLEVPRVSGVAATVKPGPELMGASPYSVKRARPPWSMTTFACRHDVSAMKSRGNDISTPRARRLKFDPRETTYPLQIPVWDVERVEVSQPLRNTIQLPCVGK